MENQIFRKKSVERVASPEQLNDYVRVANPGVWLALAAVLALLVGACIWAYSAGWIPRSRRWQSRKRAVFPSTSRKQTSPR